MSFPVEAGEYRSHDEVRASRALDPGGPRAEGSREHTLQLGFHLLPAGASSAQAFRLSQANRACCCAKASQAGPVPEPLAA